jgi:diaminopimelate decarboxylase
MPMSADLQRRLEPNLDEIADHFGTPFHIYDEAGIVAGVERLTEALADIPFREYFAVKALPNPQILRTLVDCGLGMECSSLAELELADRCGAQGEDVLFSSNNTQPGEFAAALSRGAMVNVDDLRLLAKLPEVPDVLLFRLNPGPDYSHPGPSGPLADVKFGLRPDQLETAFAEATAMGVERLGVHAMVAANFLDVEPLLGTLQTLLDVERTIFDKLEVPLEFVDVGGGLGIPYRPGEKAADLERMGRGIRQLLEAHAIRTGRHPKLLLELGRIITGPHGVLVTRVVNRMSKWRELAGVDAGISALLRPALYPDAYHHITVHGDTRTGASETVDVVGSLCENNDKLGAQRKLPRLSEGDLLIVHDTGAHSLAMGFNYNGRLRPQELLLRRDGSVELIRRREEIDRDYFSTLRFESDVLQPRSRRCRSPQSSAA